MAGHKRLLICVGPDDDWYGRPTTATAATDGPNHENDDDDDGRSVSSAALYALIRPSSSISTNGVE